MARKGVLVKSFEALSIAALDRKPVAGLTHNFYRYPARFSPTFAATAIECFSNPGDVVLDPYMGGGTTIVEALAAGRRAIGNDLNSLAAFITKVKTTSLTVAEVTSVRHWLARDVNTFTYRIPREELEQWIDVEKTKNLSLVRARFIKKIVAAAMNSIPELPTSHARDFVRCIVLRAAQWALDGRERHTSLSDFRKRLNGLGEEMLESICSFSDQVRRNAQENSVTILNIDAADLSDAEVFQKQGAVSLVVTSPPYPGVHVLYHRWQVDGRRETPAPYWIAGCNDGQGASFYNFADRRVNAVDKYFEKSLQTLRAIRKVIKRSGVVIQLVAFNERESQLPRYLQNMKEAGFREVRPGGADRIWREVPNRKWHAALKDISDSANEVVLVHEAV
jgi:DNA modification methylase